MATITVPDGLYREASRYASLVGSTPERKSLKALRDVIKRQYREQGINYTACSACHGLAVATEDGYRCLECSLEEAG